MVFHLHRVGGLSVDEIDDLLNRRSGLLGLCGDNDMREVLRRSEEGDADARLAFEVYVHRLRKYIGAYYAVLGRVDAIAFTAGVGENAAPVRAAATMRPGGAGHRGGPGAELDPLRPGPGDLPGIPAHRGAPRVTVAVVPTDEELEIARQAFALVRAGA